MPGDITELTEHASPTPKSPKPDDAGKASNPVAAGRDGTASSEPGQQPQGPGNETPPTKPLSESEVIGGGNPNKIVELDKRTRINIGRILKARQDIIKHVDPPQKLSTVDQIISELGDKIENIETGQITRQEIALAWYLIHDEIILKSADLGQFPSDEIVPPGKRSKIESVMAFIKHKGPPQPTTKTEMEGLAGDKQTSELAQLSGREPEDIKEQLEFLNQTRIDIEKALYGKKVGSISIQPLDLNKRSSNLLHGVLRQEVKRVMEQKHQGRNYEDLFREKPEVARQVMLEANTSALTRFADEIAKDFLLDKIPVTDVAAITAHAAELRKPIPQANVAELQATVALKTRIFEIAKIAYDDIHGPLNTARDAMEQSEFLSKQATRHYNDELESRTPIITALKAQKIEFANNNTTFVRLSELKPEENAAREAAHKETVARNNQAIADLEKLITAHEDKIKALFAERGNAADVFDRDKQKYQQVEGKTTQEEKDDALEAHSKAKRDKLDAEGKLREDGGDGTQSETKQEDNTTKADALERWLSVVAPDGYTNIITTAFSREKDSQFSRSELSDANEVPLTGETSPKTYRGYHRLRDHIFFVSDKAKYKPKIHRLMASDNALAVAIVRELELEDREDINMKNLNVAIVLPYLRNASQFQIGNILRRVIQRGIEKAERGEPYLKPEDFPKTGEPILKPPSPKGPRPQTGEHPETKLDGGTNLGPPPAGPETPPAPGAPRPEPGPGGPPIAKTSQEILKVEDRLPNEEDVGVANIEDSKPNKIEWIFLKGQKSHTVIMTFEEGNLKQDYISKDSGQLTEIKNVKSEDMEKAVPEFRKKLEASIGNAILKLSAEDRIRIFGEKELSLGGIMYSNTGTDYAIMKKGRLSVHHVIILNQPTSFKSFEEFYKDFSPEQIRDFQELIGKGVIAILTENSEQKPPTQPPTPDVISKPQIPVVPPRVPAPQGLNEMRYYDTSLRDAKTIKEQELKTGGKMTYEELGEKRNSLLRLFPKEIILDVLNDAQRTTDIKLRNEFKNRSRELDAIFGNPHRLMELDIDNLQKLSDTYKESESAKTPPDISSRTLQDLPPFLERKPQTILAPGQRAETTAITKPAEVLDASVTAGQEEIKATLKEHVIPDTETAFERQVKLEINDVISEIVWKQQLRFGSVDAQGNKTYVEFFDTTPYNNKNIDLPNELSLPDGMFAIIYVPSDSIAQNRNISVRGGKDVKLPIKELIRYNCSIALETKKHATERFREVNYAEAGQALVGVGDNSKILPVEQAFEQLRTQLAQKPESQPPSSPEKEQRTKIETEDIGGTENEYLKEVDLKIDDKNMGRWLQRKDVRGKLIKGAFTFKDIYNSKHEPLEELDLPSGTRLFFGSSNNYVYITGGKDVKLTADFIRKLIKINVSSSIFLTTTDNKDWTGYTMLYPKEEGKANAFNAQNPSGRNRAYGLSLQEALDFISLPETQLTSINAPPQTSKGNFFRKILGRKKEGEKK